MPIRELRQLADKWESTHVKKKGAFHLVSVSHFNSAYNLRGERVLPYPSAVIFCESRRAFFRQGTGNFASALIDSPAICTGNLSRMGTNTRVCTRAILIGSEQKSGWKLVSPFSTYRRYYHNRTVSSTRRSKSNQAILLWKQNNKFLLYIIFISFFTYSSNIVNVILKCRRENLFPIYFIKSELLLFFYLSYYYFISFSHRYLSINILAVIIEKCLLYIISIKIVVIPSLKQNPDQNMQCINQHCNCTVTSEWIHPAW